MIAEHVAELKRRAREEPVPSGKIFLNAAISEVAGPVSISILKPRFVHEGCEESGWPFRCSCRSDNEVGRELRQMNISHCLPTMFLAMSSVVRTFLLNRLSENMKVPRGTAARLIEQRQVPSMTLPSLLRHANASGFRQIKIDVEGYDGRLIRLLAAHMTADKTFRRPVVIVWECANLNVAEQIASMGLLQNLDYFCSRINNMDCGCGRTPKLMSQLSEIYPNAMERQAKRLAQRRPAFVTERERERERD
ncbi:unnamed protein product [Polarella glacialis]|uniref:Methyltransferase FkbM domain-containing protein n=1 Tax=Polarella glacialis TaxID=89957 RepID=A0A813F4G4_POLGL|nr:unnamed protein product [Polarella glacialis]